MARFHRFRASQRVMKAPQKKVGQTGSLPGLPDRPHRRSQGKLPGSAAHPCLLGFRQLPTDRSKQARMPALPGSLPYPRAALFILSGRRDRHEGSSHSLSHHSQNRLRTGSEQAQNRLRTGSEQVDAWPSLHRLHDFSERLSEIEPFIAAPGVEQKRHRVAVAGPPE